MVDAERYQVPGGRARAWEAGARHTPRPRQVGLRLAGRVPRAAWVSGEPGSGDLGELPGMRRAAWPVPSAVMEMGGFCDSRTGPAWSPSHQPGARRGTPGAGWPP